MSQMHPNCETETALQKLIPDSQKGFDGERRLYRFFRDHMPKEWHVFYNVSLSGSVDHQLDFAVLVKDQGVVNVDAKGDGYCVHDGAVCLSRDNPVPIYNKASGAIHSLDEYVRTHISGGETWGLFDYLIVFTMTSEVVIAGQEEHAFSIDGCEANADSVAAALESRIVHLLDKHDRGVPSPSSRFKRYAWDIQKRFESNVTPFVENLKYVEWDKISARMLTAPQKEIFAKLLTSQYCHVKGGAGTGKTIVASVLARRYAEIGKKVLYVCYNNALAMCLKRSLKSAGVSVCSFYRLGTLFGRTLNLGNEEGGFVRSEADGKLEAALQTVKADQKFDVLIVDETQDLSDRNLRLLLSLSKRDRHVVLFSDAEQTIFSYEGDSAWDYDEESLFQEEPVAQHQLSVNYRNVQPIHSRIAQYEVEKTIAYLDKDTLGFDMLPVTSIQKSEIPGLLSRLLERNSPTDIAVLAYTKDDLNAILKFKDANGRTVDFVKDVESWNKGSRILKTTVQAFKGLEANIVVLIGSNTFSDKDGVSRQLKYVGESRAKYELYLVD